MANVFSKSQLGLLSVEGFEPFPTEFDTLGHNSAYIYAPKNFQNPPQHHASDTSNDPALHHAWDLDAYNPTVLEWTTNGHQGLNIGWTADRVPCGEEKHTWNHHPFERNPITTPYHRQYNFLPRELQGESSMEATSLAERPAKKVTPRTRCGPRKLNGGSAVVLKCDWRGCTSSNSFSRETSLWRHIKEKHIFPDAFKCPTAQCGKSYGRMDKMREHWRFAHEARD